MISTPFKAGGALADADAAVYVERHADQESLAHLHAMDYLLIIEPRQQGKTSLLARLCAKHDPHHSVFGYVDVEDLRYTSEQAWFADLWNELSVHFGRALEDATPLPPKNCQEWRSSLRLLAQFADDHAFDVVIALDEVGSMARAAWAEPFFISLRKFHNERAFAPMCRRVSFVLSGAFHPRELIADDKISPFNIAHRVRLPDFTLQQVRALVGKGSWAEAQASAAAERIYYWTDGQPYLTQLLCLYLGPEATPADVDVGVERLRCEDENHLPPILERLNADAKLREYVTRVQSGERVKFYPRENRRQAQLELLGIIKADDEGCCKIRNRIYEQALAEAIELTTPPLPPASGDSSITKPQRISIPRVAPESERLNPHSSSQEAPMRGIPQPLIVPLQQVLMDCDEFSDPRQLRRVFTTPDLLPWRDRLPGADDLHGRVAVMVGYLADQRHTTSGNVLVLLLHILGEHYYPNPDDERHGRLLALANQLKWLNQRPAKPEVTVLEANPAAAQMLWISDAEKMLTCARAVARVEVPRFRDGKQQGKSTGTGWLVAPGLALTCWHVVEALGILETSIAPSDFQKQIANTLLTFDYTVAGNGLQYSVSALEYPTIEGHPLDYALLRLVDRPDAPLRDRGYQRLDIDAPLNAQTAFYIIQHPLGQPQQTAGDTYVRSSPNTNRILYKTPTEPGTSGSPVFNRINWRVVALHNGENESENLREGTLLKALLADLEQHRPHLYQEIMDAQSAKE